MARRIGVFIQAHPDDLMVAYGQVMLTDLSNGLDIAIVNVCNGAGPKLEYDYQNEFTPHHLNDGKVYRVFPPDGVEVEKWLSFALSAQRLTGLHGQVEFLNARAEAKGYRGRVVGSHQLVDRAYDGNSSPGNGYPDALLNRGYRKYVMDDLWQILASYVDKGYEVAAVGSLWRNIGPNDPAPTHPPDHVDHLEVAEAVRLCAKRLYDVFAVNCRWDQAYVYTTSLPTLSNPNPYGNMFQQLLDSEAVSGLYETSWEYSTGYLHWQWTTQPNCEMHRDFQPVPQEYFLNEPLLRLGASDASAIGTTSGST